MGQKKRDGIWLEVLRVRIEGKEVRVQIVGDKKDDEPEWWRVGEGALGGDEGRKAYHAIARGLDTSDQIVCAKLGVSESASPPSDLLVCNLIRIQTK